MTFHTKTSTHTFVLCLKQNPSHSTTQARFLSLSHCASASFSPLFFPLCFTLHYLSIYLQYVVISPSISFPSRSSPAMGLCPFIIHGVVLMAQAAMSDVNLCASKAHSAYTASARRVTARAPVLRYHARLNQHTQSHLGHAAHANCLLLFNLLRLYHPFLKKNLFAMFLCSEQ